MSYPEDSILLRAKQDVQLLRSVLRITTAKDKDDHAPCPMCGRTALRYGANPDGIVLFQCMHGCGKGTIVDAIRMLSPAMEIRDAIREAKSYIGGPQGKVHQNGTAKAVLNGHFPSAHQPVGQIVQPSRVQQQREELRYGNIKPDPVLDKERSEKFVVDAHDYLLERPNIPTYYKRGISMEVIRKHTVGFIESTPLKYHADDTRGWMIPHSWVLPITDQDGKLKAVKLHFERPHPVNKDHKTGQYVECEGKNRWCPFGTEPKPDKAKGITSNNSYQALWPHPNTLDLSLSKAEFSTDMTWWLNRMPTYGSVADEWERTLSSERTQVELEYLNPNHPELDANEVSLAYNRAFDIMRRKIQDAVCQTLKSEPRMDSEIDWDRYVFLCPGELKALSVLSAGFQATAVTGGEGWLPPPSILAPLSGCRVCVFYDDDPPRRIPTGVIQQPGRVWADRMAMALNDAGAIDVVHKCGGRKEKA